MAFKICPYDGRRCSFDKCDHLVNGSKILCKRHRNKFGHNRRKFLRVYSSSGMRVS